MDANYAIVGAVDSSEAANIVDATDSDDVNVVDAAADDDDVRAAGAAAADACNNVDAAADVIDLDDAVEVANINAVDAAAEVDEAADVNALNYVALGTPGPELSAFGRQWKEQGHGQGGQGGHSHGQLAGATV